VRRVLPLLLLLACRTNADDEVDWRRIGGGLSSTALRAHVSFLTDDALDGRLAGSHGERVAAQYIAAALDAYGYTVQLAQEQVPTRTVTDAALEVTQGNVRMRLEYGADFVLTDAPGDEVTDAELTPVDASTWLHGGTARARAGLVEIVSEPRAHGNLAPAAAPYLDGKPALHVTLDPSPRHAWLVTASRAGRDACQVTLRAHHDSFGPGFPGAADSALRVAWLLELARGLARGPAPRCAVLIRSSGAGEWIASEHGATPLPKGLTDAVHSTHDRVTPRWDWEVLKRVAQDQLVAVGLGR
jgi:hypothetical protein